MSILETWENVCILGGGVHVNMDHIYFSSIDFGGDSSSFEVNRGLTLETANMLTLITEAYMCKVHLACWCTS